MQAENEGRFSVERSGSSFDTSETPDPCLVVLAARVELQVRADVAAPGLPAPRACPARARRGCAGARVHAGRHRAGGPHRVLRCGVTWRVAQAPVRRAPHGLTACVLAAGLGPPLTVMVPLGAFAAAVSPAFRAWFLAGPRGFPLLRPPRHFVALVGAVACRPRAAAPVRTPRVRCAMALT